MRSWGDMILEWHILQVLASRTVEQDDCTNISQVHTRFDTLTNRLDVYLQP